ncbi:serine/threonine protein phosphatase [Serinicoccus hydrothermalis]|uniref:Serine/threonine protein phosphatase n=1 Tax=Serinicoccus hydrothermalis TaxID=1758689 RepID=A0A1B1ND88_9MICO|nr:metallophosphoesterase family protein [Serinicoccus hydrothermalis]ANS79374.1 serine/threonine protein phosphatase [Serinicoccus hydrothermalis]
MDRLTLVSDVHGNLTAYRAVLDDIERRGITRVLNLGDLVGKGPRGAECIELTQERCEVTVLGNWDHFLGRPDVELESAGRWWRDQMRPGQREWLTRLPFCHDLTVSGRRLRLLHASAGSILTRVFQQHSDEEFDGMFAATEATGEGPTPTVVGYGDIHAAYLKVRRGLTLFNVGSVGNSLDEPSASYVIVEGAVDGGPDEPFGLQFVRVAYDIEGEVAAARRLGAPEQEEYAIELRRAIYRGRARAEGLIAADC